MNRRLQKAIDIINEERYGVGNKLYLAEKKQFEKELREIILKWIKTIPLLDKCYNDEYKRNKSLQLERKIGGFIQKNLKEVKSGNKN